MERKPTIVCFNPADNPKCDGEVYESMGSVLARDIVRLSAGEIINPKYVRVLCGTCTTMIVNGLIPFPEIPD